MGRDESSPPSAEALNATGHRRQRVIIPLAVGMLVLLVSSAKAQLPVPAPSATPITGDFRVSPDDISKAHSYPDLLKYPPLGDSATEEPSPEKMSEAWGANGKPEDEPPPVPTAAPTPTSKPMVKATERESLSTGPWPAGISNIANSFPQFMNQNLALSGAPQVVGLRGGAGRTRLGPFRIGLGVAGSNAYNSNVFGAENNPQGDIVSTIAPEIFVEAGTRGTFQMYYRPSYERYMKFTSQNTVNESFSMRAQYPFTRLRLESDLSYIRQAGLFANTTGPAQQALYAFRLGGTYAISSKTQAVARFETLYQDGDSSTRQIENDVVMELEHNPTPKVRLAAGMRVGYVTAQEQLQTYVQPYLRASIRPNAHWEVRAQAGVEVREFSEEINQEQRLISPVVNLTVGYSPYRNSSYELSIYQTVFNDSFQSNIVNTQTGVRAGMYFNLFNRVRVQGFLDVYRNKSQTPLGADAGEYFFVAGSLTVSYVFHDGVELRFFDNVQQRFMGTIGNDYFTNISGISLSLNF